MDGGLLAVVWVLIGLYAALSLAMFRGLQDVRKELANLRVDMAQRLGMIEGRLTAIDQRLDHFEERIAALEVRQR